MDDKEKKLHAVTTLGIALQEDNIPQGIYQQLLNLVEKFGLGKKSLRERRKKNTTRIDCI